MKKLGLTTIINYIIAFLLMGTIFYTILSNTSTNLLNENFWKSSVDSSGVIEVRTIKFIQNLETLGNASGIPVSTFNKIDFKPLIQAGVYSWIHEAFKYYKGETEELNSPQTSKLSTALNSAVIEYAKTAGMTVDKKAVDEFVALCTKSFTKLCEPISGIGYVSSYIKAFFTILRKMAISNIIWLILIILLLINNYKNLLIAVNWSAYAFSASGLLSITTAFFMSFLKSIKESLFSHAFINYLLNEAFIRLLIIGAIVLVFSQIVLIIIRFIKMKSEKKLNH